MLKMDGWINKAILILLLLLLKKKKQQAAANHCFQSLGRKTCSRYVIWHQQHNSNNISVQGSGLMIDGFNNTAWVGTSVHRSVVAVNIGGQFEASTGSRKHIFFVDKFKATQKTTSFTGALRFVDVAKEDTELVGVNSTKGKGQQCYAHLLTLQPLLSLE